MASNPHSLPTHDIYKALFETANEGLIVVNENGQIVLANARSAEIFGYSEEELLTLQVETLVPGKLREKHKGHRKHFNDQPRKRSMGEDYDLTGQRKDGSEVPIAISLNPFETEGSRLVMALVMDISEQRANELEIRSLNETLEKRVEERTHALEQSQQRVVVALEEERKLNELKSRFVSMASHEFRTPLSTVLSSLSLLEKYDERNEPEKKTKHYSRIRTSVRHLTGILNDFLSLEKVETGKIAVHRCEMNSFELFSDIVEQHRQIAKKDQQLHYEYKGAHDVYCDPNMLRIILGNLLGNAIKYSKESKDIWINVTVSGSQLLLVVRDEGIGIPEEDHAHMFERFFRAHNALNLEGTGLGLNIVKRYVQMLGGDITFESIADEGTTFTARISLNASDEENPIN